MWNWQEIDTSYMSTWYKSTLIYNSSEHVLFSKMHTFMCFAFSLSPCHTEERFSHLAHTLISWSRRPDLFWQVWCCRPSRPVMWDCSKLKSDLQSLPSWERHAIVRLQPCTVVFRQTLHLQSLHQKHSQRHVFLSCTFWLLLSNQKSWFSGNWN